MLKRKHQAYSLVNSLFLFKRWNYNNKKFTETAKKLFKLVTSCKVNESIETFI